MKALTGAEVLIHKIESTYLIKGISTPVQTRSLLAKIIMKIMKEPKIKGFKADFLLEDEFDLRPFGVNGKVIHTPGHTEGSLSILLANGEAIVGDMISGKHKKNYNLAKYPFIWNDISALKNSMKVLLDKGAKLFYNAHGEVCNDLAIKNLLEKDRGECIWLS